MSKPSKTLANNHELGSHKGTFYRVKSDKGLLASFQNSTDAMLYANECSNATRKPYEVWASDHFEHGTEERLYLIITPDTVQA